MSLVVSTMADNLNVCLRVLKKDNKCRYDTYPVKDVPLVDNVITFKECLLEKSRNELFPAVDTTFQIGYFVGNKKFTIASSLQLAEAISLSKKGWITIWADVHSTPETHSKQSGKKRKGMHKYCNECLFRLFNYI